MIPADSRAATSSVVDPRPSVAVGPARDKSNSAGSPGACATSRYAVGTGSRSPMSVVREAVVLREAATAPARFHSVSLASALHTSGRVRSTCCVSLAVARYTTTDCPLNSFSGQTKASFVSLPKKLIRSSLLGPNDRTSAFRNQLRSATTQKSSNLSANFVEVDLSTEFKHEQIRRQMYARCLSEKS